MVGGIWYRGTIEWGIEYLLLARPQNLSPVCKQKYLIPDNNSRSGDIYLPSWSAGQPSALEVNITSALQPSLISDAARRCGFALTNAEDRKYEQYAQKCAEIGIQFVPLASESFGGFSYLVQKTSKRIALLADNRNFRPAGLSIAYNRLSQGVSVNLMRGSAKMLIARDPLLWDSFLRKHSQPHNG